MLPDPDVNTDPVTAGAIDAMLASGDVEIPRLHYLGSKRSRSKYLARL
jgi:hypothetical protein